MENLKAKLAGLENEWNELSLMEDNLNASARRNSQYHGAYVVDIELEKAKILRGDVEIPSGKRIYPRIA